MFESIVLFDLYMNLLNQNNDIKSCSTSSKHMFYHKRWHIKYSTHQKLSTEKRLSWQPSHNRK